MKKSLCNLNAPDKELRICPTCGGKPKNNSEKRLFLMGLYAEDDYSKEIEMTNEEAKIVSRVLDELNKDSKGYCGTCWIENIK